MKIKHLLRDIFYESFLFFYQFSNQIYPKFILITYCYLQPHIKHVHCIQSSKEIFNFNSKSFSPWKKSHHFIKSSQINVKIIVELIWLVASQNNTSPISDTIAIIRNSYQTNLDPKLIIFYIYRESCISPMSCCFPGALDLKWFDETCRWDLMLIICKLLQFMMDKSDKVDWYHIERCK